MFKLQRLEITGFKSFADYTEIIFTGKGITAVVGPNGCGKSNVSDAISWVLGEQRAKSLRGQEMKDVIFQGTSKRNPSGMAEVVLHLVRDETEYISDENELEDIDEKLGDIDEAAVDVDEIESEHLETLETETQEDIVEEESEGVEKVQAAQVGSVQTIQTKTKAKRRWRPRNFALDFAPGEAVTVARRLYLSGESEYLLNDKTCRLRDIQDLFAGTGLSGAHYAIIEQGRIGQILSSKPSNRRSLIEEAAGISKFRTRQRAAESRLESAKTNLGRITDIVAEVEKQTRSLRRQANKTKRYKVLRDELRGLLKQTYAAEGKNLYEAVEALDRKLETATKSERELFEKVAEKDEAFRTATQTARIAEEELTEIRAKHAENALRRDRAEREQRYQEEQIEELKSRVSGLKGEIKVTTERIRLLENEIKRLEKSEEKERNEAEKEKLKLQKAEDIYRQKLSDLRQVEKALEEERNEQIQHTAAVERLAEIERQFENTLERLTERIEGLQREGERAEETYSERRKESKKLEKDLDSERKKLEKLHKEKQTILKDAGIAREKLEKEEESLKNLNREFSRQKHRLETLEELEENRAIYAPSVQKLFAEQKKVGVEFQGTLADVFDVDEKVEKAVENLFGGYLQTVLVKTEKDAKKVVKYLNENGLGRIPILVENGSWKEKSKASAKKSTISDYLGISRKITDSLKKVFPKEMSAKVIEDIDKAKAKKDEILVTLDGDLVIGGKLFVSGKTKANEKNTSLLALKRELRQLEKDSKKSAKEIEKLEKKVETARNELAEKEEKILDLQSFIVQVERELLSREIQAKSLSQEIERAERHKKVVADETSQIENEIKQIKKKRKEAQSNAKTAEKARSLSNEKIENIIEKLNTARQNAEAENILVNEKRTLAEVASERQRSAKNALERIKNEKTDLEDRLTRQNTEIEENENRVVELLKSSKRLKLQVSAAEVELEEEENELKEAIEHLKTARESSDSMSTELADLNKRSAEARDERAGLEIKRTELVTRLKNLNENCSQDLNTSLVELVENTELEDEFEFEESKKRVEFLRRKLENFGAINMLALEELAETEERLEFLSSQRTDIIDSISAAEEALREIKRRSRQKFREAFEAINENFTEFFQELFGGGRGEMILLEAEDVLEAGIEIVAQPPGKRLQNMLLLSGGEKAMTAIALVLAIFKYRPSPFCLLDEVDAPLDDANVGRFVNRIADMSENTQFIVITHNKRTMEAAKALYGVTMQEAGISKIVSVRFE